MALIFKDKNSKGIPEGAKLLTEDQAIRYQMGIIRNWEKFSEVWVLVVLLISKDWVNFLFSFALRAGPGILGAMGALSAFAVNNHFRYKLKLGVYGRMSSYLSVVAIPAVISTLFHTTVSKTQNLTKYVWDFLNLDIKLEPPSNLNHGSKHFDLTHYSS